MTSIFGQSLKPFNAQTSFTQSGKSVGGQALASFDSLRVSLEGLSFLQQLWSWVASGYVVIPCNVGGTADAIELTPRFRSEIGASGYAHLLAFSFVAEFTSTSSVTIKLLNDRGPLDAVPVYVETTAAGAGDIVAGVPYVAYFCEAVASLSLPDRMVRK